MPRHPDELELFIQLPDENMKDWRWESLLEATSEQERADLERNWWSFLCRSRHQTELLLYGQRGYLNTHFPKYDPSRKDLWEELNRPWDFDHIHASAYFYNAKSGEYAGLCRQWGNCIGNLRAWPFADNRSDEKERANEKITEPYQMVASLITSKVELEAFSQGDNTRHEPASARALCEAIKARFIRIYRDWYESTGMKSLLPSSADSDMQVVAVGTTPIAPA